jgi:Cytochrome B6-F complex subunit VI (PetL)
MLTVVSYLGLLTSFLAFAVGLYLTLTKIKLI